MQNGTHVDWRCIWSGELDQILAEQYRTLFGHHPEYVGERIDKGDHVIRHTSDGARVINACDGETIEVPAGHPLHVLDLERKDVHGWTRVNLCERIADQHNLIGLPRAEALVMMSDAFRFAEEYTAKCIAGDVRAVLDRYEGVKGAPRG